MADNSVPDMSMRKIARKANVKLIRVERRIPNLNLICDSAAYGTLGIECDDEINRSRSLF